MNGHILPPRESYSLTLRTLFSSYGYRLYRMSKFEEYDLYAHNKDFLISDSVITFTDGSGKLLALKPDMTLSIVKNADLSSSGIKKLFYAENVYRIADGTRSYREIPQLGLECLGEVDAYCLCEVLSLALESLSAIPAAHILSVSHLGLLTEVMDSLGIPAEAREKMLSFIGAKNLHDLSALLASLGLEGPAADVLKILVRTEGTAAKMIPVLRSLLTGIAKEETLENFLRVLSCFENDPAFRVDFSVVGDIRYYNGLIFKGFVENIPTSVLSGGQYDTLMQKMGRRASAVGFAIYLDQIVQLSEKPAEYDTDILLLYKPDTPLSLIRSICLRMRAEGNTVLAEPALPRNIRCRKLMTIEEGEVKLLETFA